jgi:protein-S-isoprenylcysteine O-methyltransferase Ste14
MLATMQPLVYHDPRAIVPFYGTSLVWMLSELRILHQNRGGTGEDLDRGSRVWVVLLIAVGLIAASALAWLPAGQIPGWWPVPAGLALAVCGIALRGWAVAVLGRFFTTSVEVQPGHRVVDSGPYAVVRHPSYTGTLLTVVGVTVALGSWLSCLVATGFACAGLVRRIVVEEDALAGHLGSAWTAFASRRKRLIPLVW